MEGKFHASTTPYDFRLLALVSLYAIAGAGTGVIWPCTGTGANAGANAGASFVKGAPVSDGVAGTAGAYVVMLCRHGLIVALYANQALMVICILCKRLLKGFSCPLARQH